MTTLRTDNPDGSYSIAFYCDEQGRSVPVDMAAQVITTEYDADGERVSETWAEARSSRPEGPPDAATAP